jgi:penicillin-binding protein 1A
MRNSAGPERSSADVIQGRQRRRGRRAARGLRLRIVKIFVVALVVFVIALIGLAAGAVYALSRNLPKLGHLESSATAQTTKIYDAQGRLLAELHGAENRLVIPSSAIPAVMKQATVASEEQRF